MHVGHKLPSAHGIRLADRHAGYLQTALCLLGTPGDLRLRLVHVDHKVLTRHEPEIEDRHFIRQPTAHAFDFSHGRLYGHGHVVAHIRRHGMIEHRLGSLVIAHGLKLFGSGNRVRHRLFLGPRYGLSLGLTAGGLILLTRQL